MSLAPAVVVTVGEAGVAAATDLEHLAVPAHAVSQAETHGAGDVFVGALAAQLAGATPFEQALRYANAAAALHAGTPEADRDDLGPADVSRLLSDSAAG